MKPSYGLATTARNYLSSSISSKTQYKCQYCHLIFQTPTELHNHTKKFCTDSGFDTLAGLNIKLKNPTHGMGKKQSKRKLNDSLANALEEIQKNKAFKPKQKQLQSDILNLQRHQQDIKYMRPYMYGSNKNNQFQQQNARKSHSLYINGIDEEKFKNNYDQKAINNNQNIHQISRSKAYSFTSSYLHKFKQSNTYVSPPTNHMPLQQKAKQFSLLDKSDMSIKMMPQQQKRDYVVRKILQLEQIQESYRKNGGKNDHFKQNTIKMKQFYQQLLQKINKQKDSVFGGKISNGTRVSTPISKLDRLNESRNLIESLVRPQDGKSSVIKSKISEVQQKGIAKRQDQVRKRFHTQVEGRSKKNMQASDILDEEMFKKISENMSNNNNRQNPVIVIPIQQPGPIQQNGYSQQQQSYETQLTMKYIESLSALKDEQNKNFLQILQKQNQDMKKMYEADLKNKQKQSAQNQKKIKTLENKYQKIIQKINHQRERQQRNSIRGGQGNINMPNNLDGKGNFRISNGKHFNKNKRNKTEYSYNQFEENAQKQYRQLHPQIDNGRLLNLQSPGYYSSEYEQLSQQEKLLLQMQKQERDELQLFAHLPPEIQQMKLPSLQQLGQKRFQMEKQVIKQKLQKLKMSEQMKAFELQRRLLSEEMQNEKKKIAIHKLMRKKIKEMVKQEYQERQEEESLQDQQEDEIQNNKQSREHTKFYQ